MGVDGFLQSVSICCIFTCLHRGSSFPDLRPASCGPIFYPKSLQLQSRLLPAEAGFVPSADCPSILQVLNSCEISPQKEPPMARTPNTEKPITPLGMLLRECSREEREKLASMAGTTVNYLYNLAGCHRAALSAQKAIGIEDASRLLHKESRGRTRIVTARELATMCAVAGL